jgi:hypothetical protein
MEKLSLISGVASILLPFIFVFVSLNRKGDKKKKAEIFFAIVMLVIGLTAFYTNLGLQQLSENKINEVRIPRQISEELKTKLNKNNIGDRSVYIVFNQYDPEQNSYAHSIAKYLQSQSINYQNDFSSPLNGVGTFLIREDSYRGKLFNIVILARTFTEGDNRVIDDINIKKTPLGL